MSTAKTRIDQAVAESFVQKRLHIPGLELEQIEDGEISQAFFFETPEGSKVLRVSAKGDFGFRKDRFAQTHFASDSVPIPTVFDIGKMESGLYYAISERAHGKTLDKFSNVEIDCLMPKIIANLTAIHAIPLVGEGYGNWDLNGNGKFSSWRQQLEDNLELDGEETTSADFYDTILSKKLQAEIMGMLGLLPEERKLVHWDYGFNNTISDGKEITGVVDWEHSAYGDPLYDVAWLDFWNDKQGYSDAFKKFYIEQGDVVPYFDERIKCYKLLIGLGSLGFFASSRQAEKYEYARDTISRI